MVAHAFYGKTPALRPAPISGTALDELCGLLGFHGCACRATTAADHTRFPDVRALPPTPQALRQSPLGALGADLAKSQQTKLGHFSVRSTITERRAQ